MRLIGETLRREARIAMRRRAKEMSRQAGRNLRRTLFMLGHLDFGQREIGAVVRGLEKIGVPVETAVIPGVTRLAERLASEGPEALEIDNVDLGFNFDHVAVDRPLEAEYVAPPPRRVDRTDAHAGTVQV